jgi:hypothetical protein
MLKCDKIELAFGHKKKFNGLCSSPYYHISGFAHIFLFSLSANSLWLNAYHS